MGADRRSRRRRRARMRDEEIGREKFRDIAPIQVSDANWHAPQSPLAPLRKTKRVHRYIARCSRDDHVAVGVDEGVEIRRESRARRSQAELRFHEAARRGVPHGAHEPLIAGDVGLDELMRDERRRVERRRVLELVSMMVTMHFVTYQNRDVRDPRRSDGRRRCLRVSWSGASGGGNERRERKGSQIHHRAVRYHGPAE